MGVALSLEAVVWVVEAAESAAEAAFEGASEIVNALGELPLIDAGGIIDDIDGLLPVDLGPAVEEGGDAVANLLPKITEFIGKLNKMIQEYIVIDQVFKAAKSLLEQFTSDPAAKALVKKLKFLTDALTKCASLMKDITNWITKHADDLTTLCKYDVPMSGVLSKFLPQLGSATKLLILLSKQVSNKTHNKEKMTNGEVDALEKGLETSLEAFQQLNQFKKKGAQKVKELADIPIDDAKIAAIQQLLANA